MLRLEKMQAAFRKWASLESLNIFLIFNDMLLANIALEQYVQGQIRTST